MNRSRSRLRNATLLCIGFAMAGSPAMAQGIITTMAGTGTCTYSGDGGPAAAAGVCGATGFTVDSAGNIYFSDKGNHRIRRIGPDGIITTIAGNGMYGNSGDGGPALSASLGWVSQVAVSGTHLCFGNNAGYNIRCVDLLSGLIQGYGSGAMGTGGDGGNISMASFTYPEYVTFDDSGNIYISDSGSNSVRRVSTVTGLVTTIAGPGPGYCCAPLGDGGIATSANLYQPRQVFYRNGGLYIADSGNFRVRRVDLATGIINTVAGNSSPYNSGDGGPAVLAGLNPGSIVVDPSGNLFLASGGVIRMVDTTGIITTIAGQNGVSGWGQDDVPATQTAFMGGGLAWDPFATRLLIGDDVRIRQIFYTPATTTTLTSSANPAVPGDTVTLQATISPADATGTVRFYNSQSLLGSAPVVGGVANFSWTAQFGTFWIRAVYGGDFTHNLSQSANLTQTGGDIATTTTLSSNANPSTVGQSVTFTSSVSPSDATGNVVFWIRGLGYQSPLVNGVATYTTATLPAGTTPVSANYSRDARHLASWSPTLNQVVKLATTISVGGSPNPSPAGSAVNLTATVSPNAATGAIQFFNGDTLLGSAAIANGQAQLSIATLPVGADVLSAVYGGDSSYASSTSAPWTQTITQAPTTISVSSSSNPSTVNQAVTLTATVSPAAATGTVQFLDGTASLGSAAVSSGSAILSVTPGSAGGHAITAVYSGDANYVTSASGVVTQTVTKMPSTAALSVSSGTIGYGQNIDLTASVTPAAATGTVQLLDGATVLITLPVNGGRVQVVTQTNLTAGTHTITAVYSGDATYDGSGSPAATVTVSKLATTVALSSSENPAAYADGVVFTATLSSALPTGSVQFLDGSSVIGTAAVSAGAASVTTTTLTAGSHSITAVYAGDANCSPATSPAVTQTVSRPGSITTLSISSGAIVYGQTVNLTASVWPVAATGTVQFLDGSAVLATLPVTGGTAPVVTATNLAAGVHSFTAVYSGDTAWAGSSSAPAPVTVAKAAAAVALASSANPSTSGQAVIFTATLSPAAATGAVQFLDGATAIGTAVVSGGSASIGIATLAAGGHSITAVYGGDANCNGATSTAVAQTVSKTPTTTSVAASSGTISFGQSIVLTASVAPASATGTVQFVDGATVLGTAVLSGGSAALATANLAVGVHAIAAVYGGDAASLGGASATVTVTVVKAGTSVTLASSANPALPGQTVTFTASVSPAAAAGSVQFVDGATVIGTAALNGGSASMSTAGLAAGSHAITAVYGGSGSYNGATSAVVTQAVQTPTSTSLSTDKASAVSGQTVTFTAKVSPSAASGSVQFTDGASVIGTVALNGGQAKLAVSSLAVGVHSVAASYGGAPGYGASASAVVTVTITAVLPAAPSGLNATSVSTSQINLKWNASATAGVTYNVYAGASAGVTPSAGSLIASGIAATSYADTGLAASSTRYYVVTAVNANGESAASNTAHASTQPPLSCHVDYTVTTQWNAGFGTAITIRNTGSSTINGWQLTWAWQASQQITQAWNSNYTQSGQNAALTNASWNSTIAPGATVSGIGFNASYSGPNPAPSAFYVNGTRCQ